MPNVEFNNDPFLLPESSDKLFNDFNSDYKHNAIIKTGITKFFLFSDSYKTASIKLFESLDGSAFYANMLVYPLVFLNRHFIELRLKELTSGLNYSLSENYAFSTGHNLEKLWEEYKFVLIKNRELSYSEQETFNNTEQLILEFNSIDPNSMCFRYPVDNSKEKNPSLLIANIDLESFRESMVKLYNFFDLQSDVVFHIIDLAEDFYREIRAQYRTEMTSYYE